MHNRGPMRHVAVGALLGTVVGLLIALLMLALSATSGSAAVGELIGAGDIGDGSTVADTLTGNVIENHPGAKVFTAGDNAYPSGALAQFTSYYEPTWGSFKSRTRPSPGNHDYMTLGASGYRQYFGALALNKRGRTFYRYSPAPGWSAYSLDSNILAGRGAPQYRWLRNQLAIDPNACKVAYWHHPIYSSGEHGSVPKMRPIFALLGRRGADLVLNGHDHDYERFLPMRADGAFSPAGITEIVVGTGGTTLRPFAKPPLANTVVRNATTHGVLSLTLGAGGYTGQFIGVDGGFTDRFSGQC